MRIGVSSPYLDENDKKLVLEALGSSEISGTSGRFIPEFENKFAEYCGADYGIATTSGTTALHLALVTLGIGSGDEVLVATFTNMATFFSVLYTGAKPVPVDIEPDTWNIDPSAIESKITPKTKAIMVVHIYGHPVDMDPVIAIARKHDLFVIEDAAEAHGAEYKGKKVGALGDVGVFSFYANKIITTGEGGMVITDDKRIADKARSLRSLAYGTENRFMHTDVGFNYRMTNLQAALGVSQLGKIESMIEKKRNIAEFYLNNLKGIDGLQLPVEKPYAKNVYWMFHVVLRGKFEGKRKEITNALNQKGVETRDAFVPANMQKIFIERGLVNESDCPVANNVAMNGFYLPSGPTLSDEELEYVASSLKEIVSKI
jgi:perosamine synthetase